MFSPYSKEGNAKFMWEYIGRGQNWIQGTTTVDIRALEVRMVKRTRNWDRFLKLIKFGMICQTKALGMNIKILQNAIQFSPKQLKLNSLLNCLSYARILKISVNMHKKQEKNKSNTGYEN